MQYFVAILAVVSLIAGQQRHCVDMGFKASEKILEARNVHCWSPLFRNVSDQLVDFCIGLEQNLIQQSTLMP